MRNVFMFVYNDLTTDARVQRTASVLAKDWEVEVVYTGKHFSTTQYKTHNIEITSQSNIKKYFQFIQQLFQYCRNKKYDILYVHDYSSALPALLLILRGVAKKIIYDAHELYIPVKSEPWSLRERFFYFFERMLIKKADLVISAQEKRSQIMQEHYRLLSIPIVIRNISKLPDVEGELPSPIYSLCTEFFAKPGATIVYAGALTTDRRIDQLVRAVAHFDGQFKLLIIGSGYDSDKIRKLVSEFKGITCLLLDTVPHKSLRSLLQHCDIGYLSYPTHNLNNMYCAPNKIYEYASVYLPMIGNSNPTLQAILDEWNIGICGEDIVANIRQLADNLHWYRENTIRFDQSHSWENEAEKLRCQVDFVYNNSN